MMNNQSTDLFDNSPNGKARAYTAARVTADTVVFSEANLSKKVISASDVLEAIRQGAPAKFEGLTITGKLDLARKHIPEALEFIGCEFDSHCDAQSARFGKTLTMRDCKFHRSLTLRDAYIGGALDVSWSKIDLPDEVLLAESKLDGSGKETTPELINRNSHLYEPPPDHRSAKWDGMMIMGAFYAERLIVLGSLNLGDTEVRGSVFMSGCRIGKIDDFNGNYRFPGLDYGRLYMRQIRIDGDLEMTVSPGRERKDLKHETRQESMMLSRARIYSSLSIGSCVIQGRLNIRGARIDGALHAIMAHVHGRVLADCWVDPDNSLETRQTFIGYAHPFHSPRAPNDIRVEDNVGSDASQENVDADLKRRLSCYFQDTRIGSCVWLRGIWTLGGVDFDNAEIGGSLDLHPWHHRALHDAQEQCWTAEDVQEKLSEDHESRMQQIRTSHLEKSGTWEVERALIKAEREFIDEWKVHARRSPHYQTRLGATKISMDSLSFRNAKIGANLDMNGLITIGRVVGHNAHIRGDVKCVPFEMPDFFKYFRPHIGANGEGKSLSLYGAHIGGNLEINGARFKGAVRMRYAEIEGALIGQKWELGRGNVHWRSSSAQDNPETMIGVSHKGNGLYLYGIKIGGNVCCNDIVIQGCLCLKLGKVAGGVEMKRSRIALIKAREFLEAAGLELPNRADQGAEEVGGGKNLSTHGMRLEGVSLENARIGGDVTFSGSKIGIHFDASSLVLNGSLYLGEESGKDATAVGPETEESIREWHCVAKAYRDLLALNGEECPWNKLARICLDLARIGGDVHAHRLKTKGVLLARGIVTAEFELEEAEIGNPELNRDKPVVNLSESKISGQLRINHCLVIRASAAGPRPLSKRLSRLQPVYKVAIDHCGLGDDRTLFWPANLLQREHALPERGAISLSHTHVGELIYNENCAPPQGVAVNKSPDPAATLSGGDAKKTAYKEWLADRKRRASQFWSYSPGKLLSCPTFELDGLVFNHLEVRYVESISAREEADQRLRITRVLDWMIERLVLFARPARSLLVWPFRPLKVVTQLALQTSEFLVNLVAGQRRITRIWVVLGAVSCAWFVWLLGALGRGTPPGVEDASILGQLDWCRHGIMDGLSNPGMTLLRAWHLLGGILETFWVIVRVMLTHSESLDTDIKGIFTWWADRSEWPRCWILFYGGALVTCICFMKRSLHVVRPPIYPFKTKDGNNFAAMLSRTVWFSQGPYDAVRQVLESQGQDDEARGVYYRMRAREIRDGERSWITKLMKWVYFVAAGSGVGVAPLCSFLCLYFIFTWLAVFSNPDSVEHPSTFIVASHTAELATHQDPDKHPTGSTAHVADAHSSDLALASKALDAVEPATASSASHTKEPAHGQAMEPVQKNQQPPHLVVTSDSYAHRTGRAPTMSWQDRTHERWPFVSDQPSDHYHVWNWQDGFWMAVKVHVPLIHLWAKEKWEPAATQGWFYCPTAMNPPEKLPDGHVLNPHMRRMWWSMEYETYAVIAQIISYLTIPMLITAIGGFYKNQSTGGHGHHHHSHEHSHPHGH